MQLENALSPIVVRAEFPSKWISVKLRLASLLNALDPIDITLEGIVTVVAEDPVPTYFMSLDESVES